MKPKKQTPIKKKNTATISKSPSVKPEWLLLLILVLTVFAYSNSFNHEILNFDDNEYFANYPEVINFNFANIKAYFSNYYVLMYQPIPILTFALTYKFFGLTPVPHHVINLFFHLLNIVLVYIFAKKLTEKREIGLIAALLFAVHPMNVEAVSWISARSSSIFAFFYLASLIFYISYLKMGCKTKHLLLTILFFVLSLFSKAHAVTLPVVLVIIDIFLKRKFDKKIILDKIPFFILSLIFGIIAISDKGTTSNIMGQLEKYSIFDNFFLLSYSLSFYLYRLFIPSHLCAVYVYPVKTDGMLPLEYYAAPFFLILLIFIIYKYRKTKKFILFGSLFFLAIISLTLQIIPSRLFIVTDRYTYLPYIGLFIILGYFYNTIEKPFVKNIFTVAIIITGLIFSLITWERNKVWANDVTLTSDIINKNPEVPYIARAFGIRANYNFNRLQKPNEALKDYNTAILLDPSERITYFNRGILKNKLQDYKGVIEDLEKANSLGLRNAQLNNYLGAAYYNTGDYNKAINNFKIAIEIKPDYVEAYNNLGATLGAQNKIEESTYYIEKALQIEPENAESHRNRGIIYVKRNDYSNACTHFLKAKQLGSTTVDDIIKLYCK